MDVSTFIGVVGLSIFAGIVVVVGTAAYIDWQRERESTRVEVQAE